MRNLLEDVWNDLRQKGLWPVAALLLAAVVAVPVVLAKSSTEPPPPPPAVAEQPEEDLEIEVAAAGVGGGGAGSSLSSYAKRNPFKPPTGIGTGSSDDLPKAGVSSREAPEAGPGGSGGAPGGGGSGDGGGTTPEPQTAPPTKTVGYQYVVDLTFWNGNRKRRVKGMTKLGMLPSQSAPLLILMGVTADGDDAVFMVDSTLGTTGEGSCKPSRSDCAFLSLGAGSEQAFTDDDGSSYGLRIDEIRRVEVRKAKASSGSGKTANAAVGTPAAARRFSLPFLLTDVIESTGVQETPAKHGSSVPAGGR